MPNKDGTGPNGKWSGTGRGIWECGKKVEINVENQNFGKKNGQWNCKWKWNWNVVRRCCEK